MGRSAIIAGAGFYGLSLALYLKRAQRFDSVTVIEREAEAMKRASLVNQARVHNGYHYPRNYKTAYRSRVNLLPFAKEYADCIEDDFVKLYAIARRGSKVSARQFGRFCKDIGAPLREARPVYRKMFNPQMVEEVFEVDEFAFDAVKLRDRLLASCAEAGVVCVFGQDAVSVEPAASGVSVTVKTHGGDETRHADLFISATYAGLGRIRGVGNRLQTSMKQEITEIAMVHMPHGLEKVGVTVMDGPFFSCMPYPTKACHSLTHVRYTPHYHWLAQAGEQAADPYALLEDYSCRPRAQTMLQHARRFMPALKDARLGESLFEIKTTLMTNEDDDGRPILFELHPDTDRIVSVLGGKIDNIYDAFDAMDGMCESLFENNR